MIDYDGINSVLDEIGNREEKQLISSVVRAMKDGEITNCSLHLSWEICHICHGNGGHSRRLGVIDIENWDEESFSEYMNGRYDSRCEMCDGSGKIKVLNEDYLPEDVKEYINDYYINLSQHLAERRSEMYFGC